MNEHQEPQSDTHPFPRDSKRLEVNQFDKLSTDSDHNLVFKNGDVLLRTESNNISGLGLSLPVEQRLQQQRARIAIVSLFDAPWIGKKLTSAGVYSPLDGRFDTADKSIATIDEYVAGINDESAHQSLEDVKQAAIRHENEKTIVRVNYLRDKLAQVTKNNLWIHATNKTPQGVVDIAGHLRGFQVVEGDVRPELLGIEPVLSSKDNDEEGLFPEGFKLVTKSAAYRLSTKYSNHY